MEQEDFLPVERLIPHRSRMMLIERIKNPGKNGLQAEARVREDWPMYEKGAVNSIICIELIAQSVSAFGTWRRGSGSVPRVGLLVGVKKAEFTTTTLPIDTQLTIKVEEVSRVGKYAVFNGEVTSGPTRFCNAVLQVVDSGKDVLQKIKMAQTQESGGNSWRLW